MILELITLFTVNPREPHVAASRCIIVDDLVQKVSSYNEGNKHAGKSQGINEFTSFGYQSR